MNIDLGGRTAIISGSTGGIGLAIARGLARANADVVIAGRSQKSLDAALAEVSKQGGRGQVHGVVADLGTAAGAEILFAARTHGRTSWSTTWASTTTSTSSRWTTASGRASTKPTC